MARRKRYDVFVSYSHKDAAIVKPLVQVLGTAKRRVFWDEIIQPGQKWTTEIEVALASSDQIVIMWCCDSATSKWVTREIKIARKLSKPLIPIRLCAYPLEGAAADFQGIDLGVKLQHGCDCRERVWMAWPMGGQPQEYRPAVYWWWDDHPIPYRIPFYDESLPSKRRTSRRVETISLILNTLRKQKAPVQPKETKAEAEERARDFLSRLFEDPPEDKR